MNSTSQLYSLKSTDFRTYVYATLFVVGNIVLPQICHLVPNGGLIFLPIYFFTLVCAYKYGWQAGLLTAVLSPVVNHLLFGMPSLAVLPILLIKSTLLAVAAAFVAAKIKKVSIAALLCVVLFYQVTGCLIESAMCSSVVTGFQDFRIGLPGMAIQVFGGYLFIKYILKDRN